ncbi:MAG: HAD-IIB family hydrolase [Thermoplasmatota archaeon]
MKVFFTDLDGTLLDGETYAYDAAQGALEALIERGIPLVFCTSKTYRETIHWRRRLGNDHPFITENGGGIFIPHGYFDIPVEHDHTRDSYHVIELGVPYHELTAALDDLAERFSLRGFHQMTPWELAGSAGLSLPAARRALNRDYDEPFLLADESREEELRLAAAAHGLHITRGGRYYHLTGDHDKGRAAAILTAIYRREHGDVTTVGIGDSANDVALLDAVDRPYLVARPDGSYATETYTPAGGTGPTGWSRVIQREITAE